MMTESTTTSPMRIGFLPVIAVTAVTLGVILETIATLWPGFVRIVIPRGVWLAVLFASVPVILLAAWRRL